MKRYKLLKDLPYAKAGEVFERTTHKSEDGLSDYDYLEIRKRVRAGEDEVCFGIKYNYFLDNFNKWFEEVKEPTDSIHCKPERGHIYFYIDDRGRVWGEVWHDTHTDNKRLDLGIIYLTGEECEKARDRRLAEVRLYRTSNFEPDFKLGCGGYAVYYDHVFCGLRAHSLSTIDSGEIVRYETKEEAEKSIRENREDWLIYFGIKEEK